MPSFEVAHSPQIIFRQTIWDIKNIDPSIGGYHEKGVGVGKRGG